MVSQQSWMFLRSFAELRKGVLEQQTVDCLAHLGPRAFEETTGEVVNIALFVLTQEPPASEHRLWAARLIGPKSAEEKASLLTRASTAQAPTVVFTPHQGNFLPIEETPFVYWLRPSFFALLQRPHRLRDIAEVKQGLATGDNERFTRCYWEVPSFGVVQNGKQASGRWFWYAKGGRYQRWAGLEWLVVDWEDNGQRIKNFRDPNGRLASRPQNEAYYFRNGLTYSPMGRGSMGTRFMAGSIFDVKGASIFPLGSLKLLGTLAALLSTRLISYVLRVTTQYGELHVGYVANLPLPNELPALLGSIGEACFVLKRRLVAEDLLERTFEGLLAEQPEGRSLVDRWRIAADVTESVQAVLHAIEGYNEQLVCTAYGLQGGDTQAVLDETGIPAAWHPLFESYDTLPPLPNRLLFRTQTFDPLAWDRRRRGASEELAALKGRLRTLYEAGWGAKPEIGEPENIRSTENDEDDELAALGAHISIPAETFLEDLSQRVGVHPISVYWLLKELRKQEGVVSLPELGLYVEDYFTALILRLLGHRWPKQIEAGEPIPEWADPDGIIPLSDGSDERTLLDRVRERIAADFGEARVDAIEQEFRQIMGRSLADWLARDFFTRHVSQCKRRPIAWMLENGRALDTRWESAFSRRSRRSARTGGPAFACLVYYHKLTADTLTRIKTHYLRPVLERREFELAQERRRAAEGNVSARAAAERLSGIVDELKTFEAALDTVNAQGFLSRRLGELLVREVPDHWARRTPKSAIPDKEAFLRQEQAYDPDLNDGVRVNIAPLQKYRLLAADVLASKDIERAIEDRAIWRTDERRWCREGKLPKPGWWQDRD